MMSSSPFKTPKTSFVSSEHASPHGWHQPSPRQTLPYTRHQSDLLLCCSDPVASCGSLVLGGITEIRRQEELGRTGKEGEWLGQKCSAQKKKKRTKEEKVKIKSYSILFSIFIMLVIWVCLLLRLEKRRKEKKKKKNKKEKKRKKKKKRERLFATFISPIFCCIAFLIIKSKEKDKKGKRKKEKRIFLIPQFFFIILFV